jgi:acyl carrier protein
MNKIESIDLIKEVINEMNDMLPDEKQINVESNECIKNVDSLQLVNLIVGLEEKIEEDFNKHIVFSLEDNDNEISFLESIEALSDYIMKNI